MFFLTGPAGAQDPAPGNPPAALAITAQMKVHASSGTARSFVYISGDTIYPDGTKLFAGVQAPGSTAWLKTVSCTCSHGHFLAEIGPWDQHFPPGRYHAVASFNFDDQAPALQEVLLRTRDMEKCVDKDEALRAWYAKENPARLRMLDEALKKTGRCPGRTATGETDFQVGTDDDADRARLGETEFLRGTAEEALRIAEALAGIASVEHPADAIAALRSDADTLGRDLRRRHAADVCCFHPDAWQDLEAAFVALDACLDDAEALVSDATAALREDVGALEAQGDAAGKDERRRLARDRARLADLLRNRSAHASDAAHALAETLFGTLGLEPAPERARVFERELLAKFEAK